MKAFQIGKKYGFNSLKKVDIPVPSISPSQVLVNIKAVALNYRDRLVVNGVGTWKPPYGRIPGSDGVGIVTEIGADVKSLKKGDRVSIMFFPHWIEGKISAEKIINPLGGAVRDGTLQEFISVDEEELVKLPAFLSNEEAATLPCAALTAWNALFEQSKLQKTDTVLIQGTGGVALFSLQIALMKGATAIVLSGNDEKLERVKQMGSHFGINYVKTPAWEKEVLEITGGKGADHIVEVVGGTNINRSMQAAAPEGTISAIGLMDSLKAEIDLPLLMSKQLRLQGIEVGSKLMFIRMLEFIEANRLHPVVDKVFQFDDSIEAFNHMEQGSYFGKICISL